MATTGTTLVTATLATGEDFYFTFIGKVTDDEAYWKVREIFNEAYTAEPVYLEHVQYSHS